MDENRKIFERISEVNNAITSDVPGEVPYQFAVRHSKENIKNTDSVSYLLIACTVPLIIRTLSHEQGSNPFRLIVFTTMLILVICNTITVALMKKKIIAEVNGDNITINKKTYHHSDITEIRRASLNNLKIISGGKVIATVSKSCDGCIELVNWAKQCGILIDDKGDSYENVQKRQWIMVGVLTCGAIAAAFILYFLKHSLNT